MIVATTALTKRYAGRLVLDGASIRFAGPGVLVVRGENGAGKSTLLAMIAGVLAPDSGQIAIAGHDLGRRREPALRALGYAPDRLDLPPELTTRELVSLVTLLKKAAPPPEALVERVGARAFWSDRLGALSLGQRRRAAILLALIGDPALLVLDEPTNGLDAGGLEMLASLLRERTALGRSTMLATHDATFADRIEDARVELRGGRICD
jgi:ABC-type multidrug transport system ATPase subunit